MAKNQGQKVNRKQLAEVLGISLPTGIAGSLLAVRMTKKATREWIFDTAAVNRWRNQLFSFDHRLMVRIPSDAPTATKFKPVYSRQGTQVHRDRL